MSIFIFSLPIKIYKFLLKRRVYLDDENFIQFYGSLYSEFSKDSRMIMTPFFCLKRLIIASVIINVETIYFQLLIILVIQELNIFFILLYKTYNSKIFRIQEIMNEHIVLLKIVIIMAFQVDELQVVEGSIGIALLLLYIVNISINMTISLGLGSRKVYKKIKENYGKKSN